MPFAENDLRAGDLARPANELEAAPARMSHGAVDHVKELMTTVMSAA
jgi:hypothetical protein